MSANGQAIYQSEKCQPSRSALASYSRRGNTLYMHVYFWPGSTVALGGLRNKVKSAKLLASGVPVFMAPLDSTQIHLEAAERESIFATGNALTDQLTLLYHQWAAHSGIRMPAPTLYDPVAAAYTFRPDLCPMTPMRIERQTPKYASRRTKKDF